MRVAATTNKQQTLERADQLSLYPVDGDKFKKERNVNVGG